MEKKVIDLSKETESFIIKLPMGAFGESQDVYADTKTHNTISIKVPAPDPFDLVPKSLKEFYEKNPELKEFWEQAKKEIEYHLASAYLSYNETDIEAFLALILLRRLWHEWVKMLGTPETECYDIYNDEERGISVVSSSYPHALSFVEQSHAEKFIECFHELLEKAKILL